MTALQQDSHPLDLKTAHLDPHYPHSPYVHDPHLVRLLKLLAADLPQEGMWQDMQFWLAPGLAVMCTFWVGVGHFTIFVLPLALLTLFMLPLMAARFTVRDVGRPEFDLMRLTPIPGWQLVRGYLVAVLWKARYLLVIGAMLVPPLVFEFAFFNEAVTRNRSGWEALATLWLIANLLHLAGLLPGLVALAVGLAVRWPRQTWVMLAVGLATGLVLIVGQQVLLEIYHNALVDGDIRYDALRTRVDLPPRIEAGPEFFLVNALFIVLPYALGWAGLRLGVQSVRRARDAVDG